MPYRKLLRLQACEPHGLTAATAGSGGRLPLSPGQQALCSTSPRREGPSGTGGPEQPWPHSPRAGAPGPAPACPCSQAPPPGTREPARRPCQARPGGTGRPHGAAAPGGADSAGAEPAAARRLPSARTLRPAALCSLFLRFRDVLQSLVNLLRRHLASAAGRAPCAAATERRRDHGLRGQREERPGPRLLPAPAPGPRPERPGSPDTAAGTAWAECPALRCAAFRGGRAPPVHSPAVCEADRRFLKNRLSQNPRIARVGRDLWRSFAPPPSCQAGSPRAGGTGTRPDGV